MSWIELSLDLPQEKLELISGYLFAQGCEGINITDDKIIIYFSSYRWSEEIRLSILDYIREFEPGFGARRFKLVSVADKDWNVHWKEFFKPVHITDKLVIRPPWEEYHGQANENVMVINPQMAFGTGHHESTQLVIAMLEKTLKQGMHVLDIGTGSGILALYANMLGAESVIAIDNDPLAIKNAFENAGLNNAPATVKFFVAQPENLNPSEYDLVLANINRNTLMRYVNHFPMFLSEGGKLILSGILLGDEIAIASAFEKSGFRVVNRLAKKEWLALLLVLKTKIAISDSVQEGNTTK